MVRTPYNRASGLRVNVVPRAVLEVDGREFEMNFRGTIIINDRHDVKFTNPNGKSYSFPKEREEG